MEQLRLVVFYKSYFRSFFDKQTDKVKDKIDLGLYYLQYIKTIPTKYIGSTEHSNLLYLRIKQGSDIYRIFFCYDKNKVVVLMNGFQKKTDKLPEKEIAIALKIKKEYFDEKEK